MNRKNYELKMLTFSLDEYDQTVDLFRKDGNNLHYDKSFLKWQYEENPIGKAVGFNAFFENKLIAHYAAIPIKCVISGVVTEGLLSINTRTDSAHQGKGLFTLLAEETYSFAKKLGFNFVVGVANDNSVHGFTKKLSFQHVLKLETRFILNLKEKNTSNPEFARAWDDESVAWRLSNPKKIYLYRTINENLLIYGKSNHFQAIIGNLRNIEVPKNCKPAQFTINPFRLWIGVDSKIDWTKTVSFKIPQKLKPVTLNLIFRDLNGSSLLNPDSVKFWAMDFDAY
jgi:hypothetical protein